MRELRIAWWDLVFPVLSAMFLALWVVLVITDDVRQSEQNCRTQQKVNRIVQERGLPALAGMMPPKGER